MKIVEIEDDRKKGQSKTKKEIDVDICTVAKDTLNSGVEEINDSSLRLYKKKCFQVIEYIKELSLPKENEQLRLITKRSFNAISFLQLISSTETIEDIVLCIYSLNYEAALLIDSLIKEEKILNATILISNLRNSAHREKELATKELFIENPKIKLIFASSHAKIISFKTNKGNFYTIEGSGNLSFNSRIEQYVIDNDKSLFEFTKKWLDEMLVFLKDKKELSVYESNSRIS